MSKITIRSNDPRFKTKVIETSEKPMVVALKDKEVPKYNHLLSVPLILEGSSKYTFALKGQEFIFEVLDDSARKKFWGIENIDDPYKSCLKGSRFKFINERHHINWVSNEGIITVYPQVAPKGVMWTYSTISGLLYLLRLALLLQPFDFDTNYIFIENSNGFSSPAGNHRFKVNFNRKLLLNKDRAIVLRKLLDANVNQRQVQLLEKFTNSLEKKFIDNFVDLVSVLESILIPEKGEGIGFKLKTRACLLYSYKFEADEIWKNLGIAYSTRSKWSHNSSYNSKVVTSNLYDFIYDITAECLKDYLLNSENFTEKVLDIKMVNNFKKAS